MKPTTLVTPTIWDITKHKGWGNNINWADWPRRRVQGWTTPKPVVGDILESPMQSGKIGRFRFISVEEYCDPRDMWIATVEDLPYKEEK